MLGLKLIFMLVRRVPTLGFKANPLGISSMLLEYYSPSSRSVVSTRHPDPFCWGAPRHLPGTLVSCLLDVRSWLAWPFRGDALYPPWVSFFFVVYPNINQRTRGFHERAISTLIYKVRFYLVPTLLQAPCNSTNLASFRINGSPRT